ncbi:protein GAMETE CELL DEFECTIVE 1, mitochondrial-like [Vigna umbellata]|uniref:protein GAMETE CELL DEFECTIVE 1, mitochondrial-like n=1 Tax=Vigna umbellata TaxID=87088 RepID=UPI001F5ECAD7|nr:protein GAMETE CELL DEFECTIVE 1, mitochondrial-like [Vigna umbellata]
MRAPWESDVNFPSSSSSPVAAIDAVAEADEEAKAFLAEMNENWNERQRGLKEKEKREENGALYSVKNMKKDYRLKKQRLHVGLWLKEIEKLEEAKLADSDISVGNDIQRLISSCSEYTSHSLTPF